MKYVRRPMSFSIDQQANQSLHTNVLCAEEVHPSLTNTSKMTVQNTNRNLLRMSTPAMTKIQCQHESCLGLWGLFPLICIVWREALCLLSLAVYHMVHISLSYKCLILMGSCKTSGWQWKLHTLFVYQILNGDESAAANNTLDNKAKVSETDCSVDFGQGNGKLNLNDQPSSGKTSVRTIYYKGLGEKSAECWNSQRMGLADISHPALSD